MGVIAAFALFLASKAPPCTLLSGEIGKIYNIENYINSYTKCVVRGNIVRGNESVSSRACLVFYRKRFERTRLASPGVTGNHHAGKRWVTMVSTLRTAVVPQGQSVRYSPMSTSPVGVRLSCPSGPSSDMRGRFADSDDGGCCGCTWGRRRRGQACWWVSFAPVKPGSG